MPDTPKNFKPGPYEYHQEIELTIEDLSNLGHGVAKPEGWVVLVPFCLPGERVRARVYRNHDNRSEADLIEVLEPSPAREEPHCELFGRCGGCQYQHLRYEDQLRWKEQQVREGLKRIGGLEAEVRPAIGSPVQYGYRSKLTPHYPAPHKSDFPIGFLRVGSRKALVDVPQCPIASQAINEAIPGIYADLRERLPNTKKKKRGGTILLRDTLEGVTTDNKALVSERIDSLIFQFTAGEFFQNNPHILPRLVEYVIEESRVPETNWLVDAYCGVGVFALAGAPHFERVAGIEVSRESIRWANANAQANGRGNCEFTIGEAQDIFGRLSFPGEATSLIIDPPRRGCDEAFLEQLLAFGPKRLVYVSCGPDTQARDLKYLVAGGYQLHHLQPFDLFPQTRHIECVATLSK